MAKKLAVFFDGTWNRMDKKTSGGVPCATNVVRLFEALLPYDGNGDPQIAHYLEGIGTRKMERMRGGGFGYGISNNIKEGYRFIASNYDPGDEIFLFGFSRGAFTARSLAGMIYNMGILKREKFYLVNEAYAGYKNKGDDWHPKGPKALAFKQAHTWGNEKIRFIGVWDTVGALGAPFGIMMGWFVGKIFQGHFHDVKLNPSIESAYHGLAIDERRWPFRPTLWELSPQHNLANFEEKWFPGVHSNVGGGYPDPALSDLALHWMTDNAMKHGLGVDLKRVPDFCPSCNKPIADSQTFSYRLATVLLVKLPSYLGLVYPSQNRPLVRHIKLNGDYVRPIPAKGDIHPQVMQKINEEPDYRPINAL